MADLSELRRPTIKEVAEAAGVSRSTASRALAGNGYVAGQVRERVREAARDLGYVVDATARSLKQQSSRLIGVLVSDLTNAFYADLASGAARECRARGYTMMLIDDSGSPDDELEAAEAFVALRVAGVVGTPVSAGLADFLARQRTPVVEVDRQFAEGVVDAVVVDNREATRVTTEHLLALGHRRIALFIDETEWTTGRDRLAGYSDAIAAAGIELDSALVFPTGWDVDAAREAAHTLLSSANRPTAIFAANNVLAEGAWRAAAHLGLQVPRDLSLVSFDDAPWMSMVTPGLTSISQDAGELGAQAIATLLERIADASLPPRTVILSAAITMRGSTSAPLN
ncbi:MAG: LacI family transcriptional regulator [Rhodoglobus sp.]|nr:LacI family transcriptional regulator [Rhodoglobus sp.]